ncbi:MAG: tRNA (guanosine(46)-N7)-methyltransferase TrmB [Eubacteriales bacterium]|nr:tRNA (guanosine(46)-N7)-methyltransferase TrmB [Eubacteriales bacterium]
MRLRNIPGAEEMVAQSPYTIQPIRQPRGRWAEIFGRQAPLHLEIGCGKGRFLVEKALRYPSVNFVGIEKFSSVLVRALERTAATEKMMDNLRFIRMEAENLEEMFAPGEADRIYMNFSDPWPKERHVKRRLTSPQFLARYDGILHTSGEIVQKTDNEMLFDYSVESLQENGWMIVEMSRDFYASSYLTDNIPTEYEMKFTARGEKIFYLKARHPNR